MTLQVAYALATKFNQAVEEGSSTIAVIQAGNQGAEHAPLKFKDIPEFLGSMQEQDFYPNIHVGHSLTSIMNNIVGKRGYMAKLNFTDNGKKCDLYVGSEDEPLYTLEIDLTKPECDCVMMFTREGEELDITELFEIELDLPEGKNLTQIPDEVSMDMQVITAIGAALNTGDIVSISSYADYKFVRIPRPLVAMISIKIKPLMTEWDNLALAVTDCGDLYTVRAYDGASPVVEFAVDKY